MHSKEGRSIAIIGGGFCGMMTLIQIAGQTREKVNVTLFYKGPTLARGTAFSTYSDSHLLNVAAKNMSAYPDQPDHFVNWLSGKEQFTGMKAEDLAGLYLPRNIYGRYLQDAKKELFEKKNPLANIKCIMSEVLSVERKDKVFLITCSDASTSIVDKVILASGNHLPRPLLHPSHLLHGSESYYPDPWSEASVSGTSEGKPVMIIGTGLTMIDVVIGLNEKNFQGKIIAVSPNGFHILPHRPHEVYTDILEEIKAPYDLANLFRIFRKHVRKVKSENKSGETVVDALRSKTQEIWQALSLDDRKRFMLHVRHLWGVARHRLPAEIHASIHKMIDEGRLEIIAGRIQDVELQAGHFTVRIQKRSDREIFTGEVQRLINCTGPESDPAKFNSPVFKQLLDDKLVCVDDMRLGLRSTPEGRIIDPEGKTNMDLFVMGSLLRGTLWETTAVPELRVQAKEIASLVLAD
jgi:uncharacterized NAD(P)/FAD-binding protein YdhS